jgi:phenylacetate-CoA ligase
MAKERLVRESEYWDPKAETMPLEKLKEIQLSKIKEVVNHAYLFSPFYRRRFDEAGVKPEDIKTLEDFRRKVPFFRKDDMRAEVERLNDPYASMLTVPIGKLTTIHSSTGTTGMPTFTGMTPDEVEELADSMARSSWMIKHRPGTSQTGIGEAIGALELWHWYATDWGAPHGKQLGLRCVLDSLFGLIMGVSLFDEVYSKMPVYSGAVISDAMPAMIDQAAKRGIEPKDVMKADYFTHPGEAITPHQRESYIEKFGFKDDFDTCGTSEPMVLQMECYAHNGGHVWGDYYYVELIDPDTGEPLPPGERGEYTVTNLFMKAIPMIRYATEDFSWWTEDKCECGRTHPRIKVYDRTGYRVKVKDKTLIPYDVRELMERHPETVEANFNILKYAETMDTLRLRASYSPMLTKDPDELRGRLVKDFKESLGVDAEIEWVSFDELAKILHKLIRVVDLTKK